MQVDIVNFCNILLKCYQQNSTQTLCVAFKRSHVATTFQPITSQTESFRKNTFPLKSATVNLLKTNSATIFRSLPGDVLIDLLNSGVSVHPSVCTYFRPQKVFPMVKVTELLKLRKWHFSRSLSSAIFAWSSKLMVVVWDLVYTMSECSFRISFWEIYHVSSNFAECQYFTKFKWPYFHTA